MTITQFPAREKRLSEMARRPWKANAERAAGDGKEEGARIPMTSLLWLPLYIPLLSGFVTAHSFPADDPPLEVCLNHDAQPAARVAACRTAAEAGDAEAQFSVGVLYAEGEGVPRDYMAAPRHDRASSLRAAPYGEIRAPRRSARSRYGTPG